jgi:hypothetical protein
MLVVDADAPDITDADADADADAEDEEEGEDEELSGRGSMACEVIANCVLCVRGWVRERG